MAYASLSAPLLVNGAYGVYGEYCVRSYGSYGMDKWEYTFYVAPLEPSADNPKVRTPNFKPEELDELGNLGWEAVGMAGALGTSAAVLFKRKVEG